MRGRPGASDFGASGQLTQLPASLLALLALARALAAGQAELQATAVGQPWVQQAFPDQGQCLAWLRRDHAALPPASRSVVDGALAGTWCAALFAAA